MAYAKSIKVSGWTSACDGLARRGIPSSVPENLTSRKMKAERIGASSWDNRTKFIPNKIAHARYGTMPADGSKGHIISLAIKRFIMPHKPCYDHAAQASITKHVKHTNKKQVCHLARFRTELR